MTQSAPASTSSWSIASVMPKPPAAFSPLTTTKSSCQSRDEAAAAARARPRGRCGPTMSPMKRIRMRSASSATSITSFSVSTRSRRASRGRRHCAISCAAKAMPTARTGFVARRPRSSCRSSRRHSRCGHRGGRRPAAARCRMSGSTSGASGRGSRMPQTPEASGSPNAQARMMSGLPRRRTTGSASRRRRPASCAHQRQRIDLALHRHETGRRSRRRRPRTGTRPRRDRLRRPAARISADTHRGAPARRAAQASDLSNVAHAVMSRHAQSRDDAARPTREGRVRSRDGRGSSIPGSLRK